MAGILYQEVSDALIPFLGEKNTQSCLSRQLRRLNVSEQDFDIVHFQKIVGTLRGSLKLYCEDSDKCIDAMSVLAKFK